MALTNTIQRHRTTGRARRFFAAAALIAAIGAVAVGQGLSDHSRGGPWHGGRHDAHSIEALRQALERGSPWLDLVQVSPEQP